MMRSTLRVRQCGVPAFIRTAMLSLATCLAALLCSQPAFAADADDIGPHNLLITYRSEVRDRPAFRDYLTGEGRAPFDKLVKEGALKDYQILFNTVNTNTWDALVVLSFNRHVDTARWTELERTAPGGLSKKGLKLAKPTNTFSADLAWQASAPDVPARGSVFYVIPYTYLTTLAEYKNYVDGYVAPQVQGWMKEGVLSSYRIYMNRFPVGMPWDALFVYQYKDLAAFGRRDATLAKVRESLKDDANWQKLSAIKAKLRTESENTIAEQLDPR
jgi:hypothetical protein